MTVVATVGYPGSGKGEVANVARRLDIPVVTMGDVVRRECRRRCLPITEANLGAVASAIRAAEGEDAIANRCLPLVDATHGAYGTVLIDGIRGIAEVTRFESAFSADFTLLAIDAPFEVRLERIRARGRDETAEGADDLRERDRRERGYGMDDAFDRADRIIDNSGSLQTFRRTVRTVLTEG